MTQTSNSKLANASRRYLVTGGAGFIGSHIVDELLRQGHTVYVLDDLRAGKEENLADHDNLVFYHVDIGNTPDWQRISQSLKDLDGVFHVAAEARIQPSIANPEDAFTANVKGTFKVLEFMRKTGVKNIVYSASSSCYGRTNIVPLRETMSSDCLNPYAVTKFIGEHLCKAYGKCYDINNVSLRYFNVYGSRSPVHLDSYSPVIGLFFKQALADKTPLTVVGDGTQKRDFTHIKDVVRANIMAMLELETEMRSPVNGHTLNIGTGKNYSILEVAQKVKQSLANECPDLKIQHIEARPAEAKETLADTTFAHLYLGWEPQINLDEGIAKLKPYYRQLFAAKGTKDGV